jgi:hypothetical protein
MNTERSASLKRAKVMWLMGLPSTASAAEASSMAIGAAASMGTVL